MDDVISSFSSKYYINSISIRKTISDIIKSIAIKGYVIIVGRGSVAITKGFPNSLHIRLQAPLEWRINEVCRVNGLNRPDAIKQINDTDTKRTALIESFLKYKPDQSIFDLIFNCKTMDANEIVKSIIYVMYDEMQKNGDRLDEMHLGKLIGIPFVPTIGSRGKGINELLEKIIEVYEDKDKTARHIHINYGNTIEKSISAVQEKIRIPENRDMLHTLSSRFLSIKLLEKDTQIKSKIKALFNAPEIEQTYTKEIKRLETELLDDTETLITDAKYGFIAGALKETFKPSREARVKKSELVDVFITHKIWGIPIFIGFMNRSY